MEKVQDSVQEIYKITKDKQLKKIIESAKESSSNYLSTVVLAAK